MNARAHSVNRRKFLLGSVALAAGASGVWTATSASWTARFFRERLAEVGRAIASAPHRPEPGRWSDQAITLAWLGHASVLVNFFGVWVLVDPTFYPRIGVNVGLGVLGPQRLVASALAPGDLPELDAVVVSHAHFDHLDIPSLRAVRGRPTLITAPATADLIPRRPYESVVELPWGQTHRVVTRRGELRVRSLEVKHWGARIRRDTYRGYNGYVLEREGQRLLLGGDTADTPSFPSIAGTVRSPRP
ncbi:MAG: MBL fold metallo-hydrolase [Verrucomicrobia bacterium]|nr:MBL fold metallo-hydrolase [Verrucomicrobiota bacterium]